MASFSRSIYTSGLTSIATPNIVPPLKVPGVLYYRIVAVATDAKAVSRTARHPSARGSVPRFGEISQIFRIGFRTRGHARNKLSIVPCRIGQGLCLCRRPLMSGPSVNYRHLGGSEHKHG
jgi:hypothetical protein